MHNCKLFSSSPNLYYFAVLIYVVKHLLPLSIIVKVTFMFGVGSKTVQLLSFSLLSAAHALFLIRDRYYGITLQKLFSQNCHKLTQTDIGFSLCGGWTFSSKGYKIDRRYNVGIYECHTCTSTMHSHVLTGTSFFKLCSMKI